jgi:hypothetical protein
MMVSLSTRPEGLLFGELKELCALTDGNLSRHLDVLRDEGSSMSGRAGGRRPRTLVRLTAKVATIPQIPGRAAAAAGDTRGALEAAGTAAKKPLRPDLDFFHPA